MRPCVLPRNVLRRTPSRPIIWASEKECDWKRSVLEPRNGHIRVASEVSDIIILFLRGICRKHDRDGDSFSARVYKIIVIVLADFQQACNIKCEKSAGDACDGRWTDGCRRMSKFVLSCASLCVRLFEDYLCDWQHVIILPCKTSCQTQETRHQVPYNIS